MDKNAALKSVQSGFNELLQAIDGLDEKAMSTVFYGTWSVKDILAHIAGWHHQMAEAMQRMARGERPTAEGVDYTDADSWNVRFAAAMAPQTAATVVADLRQSFANYLNAARAIPDDRYGEGKTINRLLEGSGFGHYKEHVPAIRDFKTSAAA
jgi:hypothetical protein